MWTRHISNSFDICRLKQSSLLKFRLHYIVLMVYFLAGYSQINRISLDHFKTNVTWIRTRQNRVLRWKGYKHFSDNILHKTMTSKQWIRARWEVIANKDLLWCTFQMYWKYLCLSTFMDRNEYRNVSRERVFSYADCAKTKIGNSLFWICVLKGERESKHHIMGEQPSNVT